jgi:hypothetical protein
MVARENAARPFSLVLVRTLWRRSAVRMEKEIMVELSGAAKD